jgi:hypothetical protein
MRVSRLGPQNRAWRLNVIRMTLQASLTAKTRRYDSVAAVHREALKRWTRSVIARPAIEAN